MDTTTLGNWLPDAACTIHRPLDATKFKDPILPLVFLKRPPELFDGDIEHLGQEFGDWGSGSQGSNRERDVRRVFVAGDLVTPGDLAEEQQCKLRCRGCSGRCWSS